MSPNIYRPLTIMSAKESPSALINHPGTGNHRHVNGLHIDRKLVDNFLKVCRSFCGDSLSLTFAGFLS